MALRTLCWNGWLLFVLSGCGSATVDAGSLSNGGSGGTEANLLPDAGNMPVSGAKPCTTPELAGCRLVFDSDGGKLERRIYWMRADGTEVEALTPPEELAREPAMSPDGSKLAYVTSEGIKLLDMATRQSELLVAYGDQPAWSLDGTLLALRVGGQGGEVRVLSLNDLVTLYSVCNYCANTELPPDDSGVLYEYAHPELPNRAIQVTDPASNSAGPDEPVFYSMREVVSTSERRVGHPSLSPDGVWVVAAMECPGNEGLSLWMSPYAVGTPACEGRRITPLGAPSATNPKWGPGVLIAYERGEPPRDIALIAADTGEEIVIDRPGDDRNPSWAIETFTPPE
jgi:Tol biopolymer transport system component